MPEATTTTAVVRRELTDTYHLVERWMTRDDEVTVYLGIVHVATGHEYPDLVSVAGYERHGVWEARVSVASMGMCSPDIAYAHALAYGIAVKHANELQRLHDARVNAEAGA